MALNEYQHKLFTELMTLCAISEKKAFYSVDQEIDNLTYRIFLYRLASYTDFLEPSAIECRGIMFEVNSDTGEPIHLAALPMEKFFNVGENPLTADLDFNDPMQVMLKEDGSLMSTYFRHGLDSLGLKSKGSLHSTQVADSELYLAGESLYQEALMYITRELECTVNMEYCAPTNRIVIGYMKPKLTILNTRSRVTGEYIPREEIINTLIHNNQQHLVDIIHTHWVERWEGNTTTHEQIVDRFVNLEDLEGIEGYVIQLATGQHVKTKCEWYLVQHRAKDSINNPRRLFEVVLEEASDDLRTLFKDDELARNQIYKMEELVESLYNPLVDKVETYYKENKSLSRKDYAIKGQTVFKMKGEFGLAMNLYCEKTNDYKAHMKKNFKSYNIVDADAEGKWVVTYSFQDDHRVENSERSMKEFQEREQALNWIRSQCGHPFLYLNVISIQSPDGSFE